MNSLDKRVLDFRKILQEEMEAGRDESVKIEKLKIEEIVSKEVEDKLIILNENLGSVQKGVKEANDTFVEMEDRERRRNNIIIYNAKESNSETSKERMNFDKDMCADLLNSVLKVGYEEGDIKKIIRLGLRESGRKRPMLIEFAANTTKNLVMENANKLRNAKDDFVGVSISHDMTKKERQICRELAKEAKEKQLKDDSGDWVYRVRGPPGQMKVMKLRKR